MTGTHGPTALVLAGSRGDADPVAAAAGRSHKALVEVAGVPMLARVLDALRASGCFERIVLSIENGASLASSPALAARLAADDVVRLDAAPTPARSVLAVLERRLEPLPLVVVTADHPLLTPAMLRHFCAAAQGDVAVALADAELVQSRYPGSRRTRLAFADGARCGCNMFALRTPAARAAVEFWTRVETWRKRPWRLIGAFGLGPLARYACGRLTLAAALRVATVRLGLDVRAVAMPFADAAVDVDSAADLALAEATLRARARESSR